MGAYSYESSVYSVKETGTNHYVYIPLKEALQGASAAIPPYADITSVLLQIYADTSTASNTAGFKASLTNSNGGTTYLSNFASGSVGGNGSSITNYTTISYEATSWFNDKNANSGDINGYGGNDTYLQCYFNLLVLIKHTFAAKYTIAFGWNDPYTSISVTSNIGDDCVSPNYKTVYYGNSCTITAKEVEGYKFVKWSDGNTNASRTITVDDAFLATHKAHHTSLAYEAIYEVDKTNKIYIGTSQPKAIYVGTQEVKAVYVGTTKVYG